MGHCTNGQETKNNYYGGNGLTKTQWVSGEHDWQFEKRIGISSNHNMVPDRFELYFVCDCGFTKKVDVSG